MQIELEYTDLLIFIEAGINGSHLRWHIVDRAIDEFYHLMSSSERNHAYNYFKRLADNHHMIGNELMNHLLWRYQPDNQFMVVAKIDCGNTYVSAYLAHDTHRYHINMRRFVEPDFIIEARPI